MILSFNDPGKIALENIVRKGEDADDQYFLIFTRYFPPYHRQILQF